MWIFLCTKNSIFLLLCTPTQFKCLVCGVVGQKFALVFHFPNRANDNIYALIDVIFLITRGGANE